MANYNYARFLPEALSGIRSQTRPADQIIIVDDGSDDHSIEIIERFSAANPAVLFLRNAKNLGVHASIARALSLVTTDYLVWTAADDRLLSQFIEKSMAAVERHPQAGLCLSETTQLLGTSGSILRFATEPSVRHIFDLTDLAEFSPPAELAKRMRRAYLPIASNTVIVKREALLSLGGYDQQLKWFADSFAYTVIALRYGACVVAETLAVIRTTADSYSSGMHDRAKQSEVLQRMLDTLASREYRDVRRIFRACPSVFSPGWNLMLRVQLGSVRDWDLFLPYLIWRIREYKRGHGLNWFGMIAHLLHRLPLIREFRRLEAALKAEQAAHAAHKIASEQQLNETREQQRAEIEKHTSQLQQLEAKWNALTADASRLHGLSAQLQAERDGFANALQELRIDYEATKASAEQSERRLHIVSVATAPETTPVGGMNGDQVEPPRIAVLAMMDEMKASEPIYAPSKFWQHFNEINVNQLASAGFNNFKLTANLNYHNFAPRNLFDAKVRRLVRLWRQSPTLKPLLVSIEDGFVRMGGNEALRTQQAVLGFSNKRMFHYKIFVALLWVYSRSVDHLRVLDRLREPELGNPIRVLYEDQLISQDLATSSREFNAIMGAIPQERRGSAALTIGELGAGYGRLAHVFAESTPCRYIIFDIPPALGVAQWYLGGLFPKKRIFRFRHFSKFSDIAAELERSEIAFFTPNQIALFPDRYFDLFVSISSLHEMRVPQIEHYLAQMSRLTARFMYLKQYYRYVNPYDNLLVERSAYHLPEAWQPIFEKTEAVYADFFELMLKRTA